jgi:hypothetical protein
MPHHHSILDAHAAAVLQMILGLTSLIFIQVLVDCIFVLGHQPTLSRTYLLSHLCRRIRAETVHGHHRCPPGLPHSIVISFRSVAVLVAGAAITILFWSAYAPVPAPDILVTHGPVAIVTEVSGRIEKVYVREGSVVRIGDPIVQLDTRDLRRKKHTIEARIHLAELDGVVDRVAVSRLYSDLHQLQVELGRCTITSPTEGNILALKPLHIGELLSAGTAIGITIPMP